MSRRAYWQSALLLAVVIGTLALMWRSAAGDPGPTGLPNDLKYRHNFPGDFRQNAILVLVEAAIAMLLIRPWSYNRSSGRTIIAAFVFLPWLILNLAFMMHSGGIMALHTLWLLALWLSFVVAAAWSGIARPVNRAPRSAGRVP